MTNLSAQQERTQFDYLLNAFEHASQASNPAERGYADKRKALIAYVRELEAARSAQAKAPTPCEHRYAFRDCADAAEDRYLREQLAMLQESYAKATKPYIDRLVALHSRSVPQMVVPVEQAQALGLMPANVKVTGAPPTDASKGDAT